MPVYNYKAKSRYGIDVTGKVEAADVTAVAARLKEMGYLPVDISPEGLSLSGQLTLFLERFGSVKPEDLIVFTRQLSSILDAGVPLLEALEALYEQVTNPRLKKVIFKMRADIEGGGSFSDALAKEPNIFPQIYTVMVRAGERGGVMGEVLTRLGDLLERDFETVRAIRSATRYPLMLVGALVIAFMIVINFVVPRFAELYSTFKTALPLPTRLLIGLNQLMTKYGMFLLVFLLALGYGVKRLFENEPVRMRWDKFVLQIPVMGVLLLKLSLSRFCRLLSAMLKSGIPIVEALTITKSSVQNLIIAQVIDNIREEVIAGKSFSEPMKGSKVFPPLVVQMIAIGEKAGSLEQMLSKIADYYDRDTDYMIKNLTPLIEPFLILILAGFVTLLALGIFLPMWDMVKLIK